VTNPPVPPAAGPAPQPDDFARLVNGYAELPSDLAAPNAPPALGAATTAAAAELPAPPGDPSEKATSTPEERIAAKLALYAGFLKSEGYRYEVDEDGDISLRREGRWLALFASDDDPNYFRFSLPNLWECEGEREEQVALETVNQMNRTFKVVKFALVDGWVWANVEQYFHPLEAFRGSFDRSADLLCETAADFRRRMRQAMAAEPPAGEKSAGQRGLVYDDCTKG
jgi:hypothetical protein